MKNNMNNKYIVTDEGQLNLGCVLSSAVVKTPINQQVVLYPASWASFLTLSSVFESSFLIQSQFYSD